MFISHFEVIKCKSGSVVFQTTLWDAFGDTIAFSFAPPLDENHPEGSRTPCNGYTILYETSYATCPSLIMHLVCAPRPLRPPPPPLPKKNKSCVSIVFNFSWDGCNTQEKWKTKLMQNVGGGGGAAVSNHITMETTRSTNAAIPLCLLNRDI